MRSSIPRRKLVVDRSVGSSGPFFAKSCRKSVTKWGLRRNLMADPDQVPHSRPDLSETDVLSSAQSVEFEPLAPDALVNDIKDVADKLVTDQTTRGDLKIILRA